MKKIKVLALLSLLSVSFLSGCYKGDDTGNDEEEPSSNISNSEQISNDPSSEIFYKEINREEYNEAADSLEGLSEDEIKDFSLLIDALSKIESNYTKETQVYFNETAIERVNKIYETEYVNKKTTLYSKNCAYTYDEDGMTNLGYIYKESENKTYQVALEGETVEERLSSKVIDDDKHLYLISENQNLEEYFFTIKDINEEYIQTYGPTTEKYNSYVKEYLGWTRVSKNKFKCDREEVIKHFMEYLAPGFTNGGTYMTFSHVTIEVNEDENNPLRLRLYASSTQIGKLIEEHKIATVKEIKEYQNSSVEGVNEEEISQWYLLFAEANITNINTTSIVPLENYIAK